MGAMSMHVSSFILHSPGVTLDHKFVGGPTLKFINKKKQRGLFSRSRLILSSGTVNTTNEMVSESYKDESGNVKKSAISGVGEPSKDNRIVFVAGATGKVGSRTVRELLKLGFRVRAGVRSLQKAEPLLESVAQLKLDSQSVNPSVPLSLFWGVLIWKRKAEEALISSGLPYSIVRPGGMERPTDTYKETHNLVLASKDTYFGGQVSNLQVAELFACMADNTELSVNKVVEVIAETTAPLLPIKELLAKVSIADGMEQKSTSELVASAPVSQSSVEQDASESAPPVTAEKAEQQPNAMRSLSPYSMYEDLKPPTSPTPKQC
ncbi:protein TIC 62, chloroplastic isoform X3 [Cryptomeria japonica]|uniref:protein TIC 62, chloroplastic isoform X3 n=1 Tax=Cryptomeria japonica TaxID=3369 RepID=UPI0027D9E74A|nr:protein TIC 62, chloroplastic isoform X3 [Cryptomeria japonica]